MKKHTSEGISGSFSNDIPKSISHVPYIVSDIFIPDSIFSPLGSRPEGSVMTQIFFSTLM